LVNWQLANLKDHAVRLLLMKHVWAEGHWKKVVYAAYLVLRACSLTIDMSANGVPTPTRRAAVAQREVPLLIEPSDHCARRAPLFPPLTFGTIFPAGPNPKSDRAIFNFGIPESRGGTRSVRCKI